jgi:hypothetical protein
MNLTRIAKHARGALAAVADALLKFLRNQDEGARRWDGVWHGPPPPLQHINCRCAVVPIVGESKAQPHGGKALAEFQWPPGATSRDIAKTRLMLITKADRIRLRDPRYVWIDAGMFDRAVRPAAGHRPGGATPPRKR